MLYIYLVAHMLYIYLVAHMLYMYLDLHREPVPRRVYRQLIIVVSQEMGREPEDGFTHTQTGAYLDLHREPVSRRVYRQLIIVVSQEMGREPEDGFTHTNRSVPGSAQRTCAPPCLPPAHHRSQPENGA